MEDCREFVIPVIKGQEIRQFRNFINDLFGVKVEFTTDLRSAQRTSNEWVKVTGLAERRQKAEVRNEKVIMHPTQYSLLSAIIFQLWKLLCV